MKRISFVLFALLLVLVSCSSNKEQKIIDTTTVEIMKMMDNKETFIVEVASESCSACQVFKPVLEEAVKNKGFKLYRLALDKENVKADGKTANPEGQANVTKFLDVYLAGKVANTPTMLIIENGSVKAMKVGALQYTELIEWLGEFDVIKN